MPDEKHPHNDPRPENHHCSMIRATPTELQFRIIAKDKTTIYLDYEGFPRPARSITAQDFADAYKAEQLIERLTGLRIHILQVVPEDVI